VSAQTTPPSITDHHPLTPQPDANQPAAGSFALLSRVPNLAHGVFTRHGGVSQPPYASLNVAWNNGDSVAAVGQNLARIRKVLGVSCLVTARQVHGANIEVIDETALAQATERTPVLLVPAADALVTSLTGVGLLVKIADCQAVFLVDPKRKIIANIHCGWRGSVQDILGQVVQLLQDRFQCRPQDLLATISPSLGPCCAEFRHYRQELPEPFWAFSRKPEHFDFWAISQWQLLNAGLLAEHIEVARRCTVCEPDQFFSYRAERVTGRMAAVLAWNDGGPPRCDP
jgi:YfiH family protein